MTVVRFTDGRKVDVIDADCEFRPCFTFGFDKGSFTPGQGYTSYHAVARPVCFTRHLNGCPHVGFHWKCGDCHATLGLVLSGESYENLDACPECGSADVYRLSDVLAEPQPCCENPQVPTPRKGTRPYRQTCKSCGAKLTGKRMERARQTRETLHIEGCSLPGGHEGPCDVE